MTDRPEHDGAQDTESEESLFPHLTLAQKIAAFVALLVLGLVFVRFAIPPASTALARPDGHPPGPCALCHLVTSSAGAPNGR